MKTITTLTTFLFISCCVFGQGPFKRYFEQPGGTNLEMRTTSMQQCLDGGYITTGNYLTTSSPMNKNVFLMKTNEHGDLEWMQKYDLLTMADEQAEHVIQGSAGQFFVTGRVGTRCFVFCTDAVGNMQWHHYYEGQTALPTHYDSWGHGLLESGEDLLVTGSAKSLLASASRNYLFVMALNPSDGTVKKSSLYYDPATHTNQTNGWGRRIIEHNGEFIIAGTRQRVSLSTEAIVLGIDPGTFAVKWSNQFVLGANNYEWRANDIVANGNEYAIAGTCTHLNSSSNISGLFLRINSTGGHLSSVGYEDAWFDEIVKTTSGYALCGRGIDYSQVPYTYGCILNTDGLGNKLFLYGYTFESQLTTIDNIDGLDKLVVGGSTGAFSGTNKNTILSITGLDGLSSSDPINLCNEFEPVKPATSGNPTSGNWNATPIDNMAITENGDELYTEIAVVPYDEFDCKINLTGSVFHDANHNGIYESGLETKVVGRKVLVVQAGVFDGFKAETVTDINGDWYIEVPELPFGHYDITIERFKDEVQTTPINNGNITIPGSASVGVTFFGLYTGVNCNLVNGMVAYYHFEETSGTTTYNLLGDDADFSDGTTSGVGVINSGGSPNNIPSVTGYSGNTLDMNTNDLQAETPYYSDLDFDKGSWSLEFAMKVNSLPIVHESVISNCIAPLSGYEHGWYIAINASGRIGLYKVNRDQYSTTYCSYPFVLGGIAYFVDFPQDNAWHHYAFSDDDATEKVSIYIDGQLKYVADFSKQPNGLYSDCTYDWDISPEHPAGTFAPLIIGSPNFDGMLDEVSLYKRALSTSEVQNIYNNGKCFDYLKFDAQVSTCNTSNQHEDRFTLINGSPSAEHFRWSAFGLNNGVFSSTVEGPDYFTLGAAELNNMAGKGTASPSVKIPCKKPYNSFKKGGYGLTAFNETLGESMVIRRLATSVNQYDVAHKPEQFHNEVGTYRLGNDGTILSHSVSDLSEKELSIYPNPFSTSITIEIPDAQNVVIRVYDIYGRVLHEKVELGGTMQIQTQNWPSGAYIIESQVANRASQKQTLLKY